MLFICQRKITTIATDKTKLFSIPFLSKGFSIPLFKVDFSFFSFGGSRGIVLTGKFGITSVFRSESFCADSCNPLLAGSLGMVAGAGGLDVLIGMRTTGLGGSPFCRVRSSDTVLILSLWLLDDSHGVAVSLTERLTRRG